MNAAGKNVERQSPASDHFVVKGSDIKFLA
jgi:hypothetical protein